MLIYSVDVRLVSKLGDWCPDLRKIVTQKIRGGDADRVKDLLSQHDRRMYDTLDEECRKGQYFFHR